MNAETFWSRFPSKLRDLLSAVESKNVHGNSDEELKTQFEALLESEKNEHDFDYVLLVTCLQKGRNSMSEFLIRNNCKVKISTKTRYFCTPLYYTVKLNDVTLTRDLIKKGASISDKDKNDITPFELAFQKDLFHLIDIMLDNLYFMISSKNINATCETDVALFHMACWRGNCKAVKMFLECGFSVNSRSNFDKAQWSGFTPMHFALKNPRCYAIDLLLRHDIDFHARDHCGKTPLIEAFLNNRVSRSSVHSIIRKYVHNSQQSQFDNPVYKNDGLSHFHIICSGADGIDPAKHISTIKFFLDNGVDINSHISLCSDIYAGYTALHFAVEQYRLNVVEYLLVNGADLKKETKGGSTPLHLACRNMDPKLEEVRFSIVDLLLKQGADVDAKDHKKNTPIHYEFYNRFKRNTSWTENDPLISLLLSKSRSIDNYTDEKGLSHLHIASSSNLLAVKTLIELGASLDSFVKSDAPFFHEFSALHIAVFFDKVEIVEYLLDQGVDPDVGINNYSKITPLHVCCKHDVTYYKNWLLTSNVPTCSDLQVGIRSNRLRILELLLKKGASVDAQKLSGHTPLFMACEIPLFELLTRVQDTSGEEVILNEVFSRQKMMIDILMSYGANINFCSKYHGSVLHVIARQHPCVQRKRLAEFFLKKGVSLKLVTGRKYTSLHVAVQEFMDQQKDDGFMDLLLESGADVSAETVHGNNSLHVAMQVSHSDVSHNHAKFKQVLEKCLNYSDFNINAQNKHGATILHMALRRDDFECTARILHDSDADMTIKDSSGVPPIFLLCSALKYHAPNLLVNRSRLNWFISFATHIMKLMSIRPSIRESLQEYSSILAKLSPRKFADLEISINNEVNILKAKKIDNYTSLYDILLKSPHDVAKHSKNKDFSELISSIEFKTDFPVFSSDLIRQFKKGSTRASILDAAKPALDFVTNTKWPECCAENILKYLRNVHLENLSKCNCIFYSTQSKSVSAANESSNKRAKLS